MNVFSHLYEEGAEIFSTEQNKFIFGVKHFCNPKFWGFRRYPTPLKQVSTADKLTFNNLSVVIKNQWDLKS